MGKKFISCLGTTGYKTCTYYLDNKKANPTPFIQQALIELLCNDWTEEDKAIILLTEQARAINWNTQNIPEKNLKESISKANPNIEIIDKSIKDGMSIDEIWSIFDTIMESLDDGDEVIFDITNGFRSIPMLALSVLNYAKVVKNIKILGIYYGVFDPNEYRNGKTNFAIVDLTSLNEILEWSQSINTFIRYGNSEHIKDMSKDILKQRIIDGDKEARAMRLAIDSLNNFTSCLSTCRGKYIADNKDINSKNSIKEAYEKLDINIKHITDTENKSINTITPLFSKLEERISIFKSKENMPDNLSIGMATVKWSIDNNLIQQGYTALEETIKTYLCYKYGLDETDRVCRENIVSNAMNIKARNIPEEKWSIYNETEDEFKEIKENIKNIIETIDKRFIKLSGAIKRNRHDINHFGLSEGKKYKPKEYSKLENELKTLYNEFEKIINENDLEVKNEVATSINESLA